MTAWGAVTVLAILFVGRVPRLFPILAELLTVSGTHYGRSGAEHGLTFGAFVSGEDLMPAFRAPPLPCRRMSTL